MEPCLEDTRGVEAFTRAVKLGAAKAPERKGMGCGHCPAEVQQSHVTITAREGARLFRSPDRIKERFG